jgi:hypothetical protein
VRPPGEKRAACDRLIVGRTAMRVQVPQGGREPTDVHARGPRGSVDLVVVLDQNAPL